MKIIYSVLLLILLAISIAFPQWKTTVEENNIISAEINIQTSPAPVVDKSGGIFIAWIDSRTTSTGNDIYVQRFDKLGYAFYEENGIPVCTASGDQGAPLAVCTSDSGFIIFWTDNRTNYTNATDLYAQKIDASGNILWAVDGVPVSQFNTNIPGGVGSFTAVEDDNGGAYVTWIRNYYGYGQLRAQRIDKFGNIMWDSTGAVLTDGAVDSRSPRMIRNHNGVSIVYRHNGGGYSIFFQMVNPNGNLKFPAPGKSIEVNGPQGATSIAMADTANGEAVVIAWSVGNFGLAGSLYVQAVDTSGNKLWGDNHITINNVPGEHSEFKIVRALNSTDYYLIWKDGRRINVAFDIYAQKINNFGQAQWTPNGIKVSGTPYTFTSTSISAFESGVYTSWSEASNPQGFGIYAQKINPDSTFAWQNNSVRLTDFFANPILKTLDTDNTNGGAVVVFSYTGAPNGTAENVYAKYIGSNGILGGVTSTEGSSDLTTGTFSLSQNYPNPFNPLTRISWQTSDGVYQTLKVYDMLGNEITTLVNEYRPAGSYNVEFNANNLSSGVYFYKLVAGNYTKTKKMILMK